MPPPTLVLALLVMPITEGAGAVDDEGGEVKEGGEGAFDAAAPDAATTAVASELSTGSAQSVHVLVSSDQNVDVALRLYAPGRQVYVDTTLGSVLASTPAGFKYTGVLGVVADVLIVNASGFAATVTAHATARG